MIKLNIEEGELIVDNLRFNKQLTIENLFSNSVHPINIRSSIINKPYESFAVTKFGNNKYSLYLTFLDNILQSINVGLGEYYNFSPFIITDGEINILKKILHEIGGERLPLFTKEKNKGI